MPENRPVSLLARTAVADLAQMLQTGKGDVEAWIARYSWHDRPRDTGVLTQLAEAAAETVTPDPTAEFYRPELEPGVTEAARMAAQLVAAQLNGDDSFDDLVRSWVSWPPPARADVLRELVGAIVHTSQ